MGAATELRKIGKYEIVAPLGRGGAGEVFLALATGLGGFKKLVVVKMLHSHFEDDKNLVEMFLDEARLAARLSHPNVVQTLEVGVEGDRHFIAMTYLEGLPLDQVLARFGKRAQRIPPPVGARIVIDVLDGLAYAHQLKDYDGAPLSIVHRDVSPSNVFVCWDGSVKLLDFGIAKAERRRANTDSGIIKGKFGYIAPEQATGDRVDARADIWSCGVVLWELLSSKRLFPNLNDVTTLRKLVAGTIPSIQDAVDEPLPAELVTVVERALQRSSSDRYADATEMRDELQAYLDSLETAVTRDDVAECIGERFAGEREAQQATVRAAVGGGKLAATPSGSFRLGDETSKRIMTLLPPEEERVALPKEPLILALLAVIAIGAILAGTMWMG